MAASFVTVFRVVQIYKGNILRDLVVRRPREISLGVHDGFDLLSPVPGKGPGHVIFKPGVDGRYQLVNPQVEGQPLLGGLVTREDGASEEAAGAGQGLDLAPGDWARLTIAGADDLEICCQYVKLPQRPEPPAVFKPFVRVKQAFAGLVGGSIDEYTLLAAVVMIVFLLLCFLASPHGTHFESTKISRRFSAMVRTKPPKVKRKKQAKLRIKQEAMVVRMGRNTGRAERRERTNRVVLRRRNTRSRRVMKGGLLALNRAMRASADVAKLFKSSGLFTNVDQALAGLGPGSGHTGSGDGGDGVADPYGDIGGGGGALGSTALGGGPRLRGPKLGRIGLAGRSGKYKPQATIGPPSVSGSGLTKGQILKVVRRRRGSIKYCYESALRVTPGMGGGKVTVQWKIGPDGKVIGARVVGNSLASGGRVGSCISRSIRRWRFPSSNGYAVVRFPFLFSSGLK